MTADNQPALCRLDTLADGGVTEVIANLAGGPTSIVLMRAGDRVNAFHNVCPHAGRALNWAPGRFLVEDGMVVCAAHGAGFRIPDGVCITGPCRGEELAAVAVEVVDGEVRLAG